MQNWVETEHDSGEPAAIAQTGTGHALNVRYDADDQTFHWLITGQSADTIALGHNEDAYKAVKECEAEYEDLTEGRLRRIEKARKEIHFAIKGRRLL